MFEFFVINGIGMIAVWNSEKEVTLEWSDLGFWSYEHLYIFEK
jgi:hypothetical protein